MRRKDRELTEIETKEILERGEYGVLSLIDEDELPYAVPMSYVYNGDVIYFHCSPYEGKRLLSIKHNPNSSFVVVSDTLVLPDKFSTIYHSAITNGKVEVVTEEEEKRKALTLFLEKYSSSFMEKGLVYLENMIDKVTVLRLNISSITGKSRKK